MKRLITLLVLLVGICLPWACGNNNASNPVAPAPQTILYVPVTNTFTATFPPGTLTATSTSSATPTVTFTPTSTFTITPTATIGPGQVWGEDTFGAAFTPRKGHTSVIFNNEMWVIGGNDASGFLSDVWNSTDGADWYEAANSAAFPARWSHTSVVFNGRIWVIGGIGGSGYLNDVWSSTDGATWINVLANNPSPGPNQFPIRYGHTTVVFNNKMWVIGGFNGTNAFNDVWSSTDGITWTNVLPNNASPGSNQFSQRLLFSALVYNNKMWVISGFTFNYLNDVWSSTDGIAWTKASATAPFPIRYRQSALVYNNKMWVMGGSDGVGIDLNDIWSSADGSTWAQAPANNPFPGRSLFTVLDYNNKMWAIGGLNGSILLNDVWHSP